MGVPLKLQSTFVNSSKRKHWVSPRSSSPASKLSIWGISWKVDAREARERRRESGVGGEKGFLWPLAASLAFSRTACFDASLARSSPLGTLAKRSKRRGAGRKGCIRRPHEYSRVAKQDFSPESEKNFSVLTLLVVGTSSARVIFVNRVELYRYAVPQPPWHMSLRQKSWKSQTTRG